MEEADAARLARIALETAKHLLKGADAEDAAQEALARILAAPPDSIRDIERYLRVVVRRLARHVRQRTGRSPELLGDRDLPDPDQLGDTAPESVRAALDGLLMPDRARRLAHLILKGVHGTRPAARALGWQPQEVRRARRQLLAAILGADVPVEDSRLSQALRDLVNRARVPAPPLEEEPQA